MYTLWVGVRVGGGLKFMQLYEIEHKYILCNLMIHFTIGKKNCVMSFVFPT